MALFSLPYFIAQATYGEGAYGSEGYQLETATTSDDTLANTGMPIVVVGTIGVVLLLAAVILFVHSRKKN